MFDIGFQELIVICVVALLVVGPKRLPELAKTIGKRLGELKRALDSVKAQMNSEMKELEREAKENEQTSLSTPNGSPVQNITVKSELTPRSEES